jgi:hypothetical protein
MYLNPRHFVCAEEGSNGGQHGVMRKELQLSEGLLPVRKSSQFPVLTGEPIRFD